MNQINNNVDGVLSEKAMQMRYVTGELEGMRKVISYLWDENQQAFNHLLFIKSNYKEWAQMMMWLKHNKLVGQKLVDFFANESPDNGGTHMGAIHILSRLKGLKFQTENVKMDELL